MVSAKRRQALIDFLLDHGLAEERAGYGHATAEKVADLLIEANWILPSWIGFEQTEE